MIDGIFIEIWTYIGIVLISFLSHSRTQMMSQVLINKDPRSSRFSNRLRTLSLSRFFSVSPTHGGRPTSGGCTLINGNLAARATGRPYIHLRRPRRMRNDPGVFQAWSTKEDEDRGERKERNIKTELRVVAPFKILLEALTILLLRLPRRCDLNDHLGDENSVATLSRSHLVNTTSANRASIHAHAFTRGNAWQPG